ncbi:MAG: DUF5615 family PIN-like protein [Candidatus Levybacteria bacterium]|nr:DUF5615 family PIN-like protein [Candidatus Levybacteria bacterium]
MDSAFAISTQFPKLKKKANIAHCVHDCQLSTQAEDQEIYQTAVKENRFVLTINFKDFKPLVQKGKPGVIGIQSQLSNEQIDKVVCTFISEKNPDDFIGKAIKI